MGSFRSVGVNGLRSLKGFASLTIDTALASADLLVIEGQQAFNFQRSKIGAKHQANIRDKVSTVDSIVQVDTNMPTSPSF